MIDQINESEPDVSVAEGEKKKGTYRTLYQIEFTAEKRKEERKAQSFERDDNNHESVH